jgi:predicted Zn-dependent peptidase
VRGLAEKYFGGWRRDVAAAQLPSAAEPLPRPPAALPRQLQRAAKAGPAIMQAYYRPGIASPDAPILDIIRRALRAPRLAGLLANHIPMMLPNACVERGSVNTFPDVCLQLPMWNRLGSW